MQLPDPRLAVDGRPLECTIRLAYGGAYQLNVNVGLLAERPDPVAVRDWVLIPVGFELARIDKEETRSRASSWSRSASPSGRN